MRTVIRVGKFPSLKREENWATSEPLNAKLTRWLTRVWKHDSEIRTVSEVFHELAHQVIHLFHNIPDVKDPRIEKFAMRVERAVAVAYRKFLEGK